MNKMLTRKILQCFIQFPQHKKVISFDGFIMASGELGFYTEQFSTNRNIQYKASVFKLSSAKLEYFYWTSEFGLIIIYA